MTVSVTRRVISVALITAALLAVATGQPERNHDEDAASVLVSPDCAAVLLVTGQAAGGTAVYLFDPLLDSVDFAATGIAGASFASWWQSAAPEFDGSGLFDSLRSIAAGPPGGSRATIESAMGGARTATLLREACAKIDGVPPDSAIGKMVAFQVQAARARGRGDGSGALAPVAEWADALGKWAGRHLTRRIDEWIRGGKQGSSEKGRTSSSQREL